MSCSVGQAYILPIAGMWDLTGILYYTSTEQDPHLWEVPTPVATEAFRLPNGDKGFPDSTAGCCLPHALTFQPPLHLCCTFTTSEESY